MTKFSHIKTFSAIILCSFLLLPCLAQPYTVYECNFENWMDGKPNGWESTIYTILSQYTPPFSGSYSCKMETTYPVMSMNTTEMFPIHWGKKYILSFTAKMIQGTTIRISIRNSNSNSSPFNITMEQQIAIDSQWKDYEIEFISNGITTSSGNKLFIQVNNPGGSEFVVDRIKLVAKDNTMEFNCLDVNNIKACINPIIPFLADPTYEYSINRFEVPKNSGKGTISLSNLWMGGYNQPNQQGNLHVAAQRYCHNGRDFWMGPISNDYETVENDVKLFSDDYIQKYYHTWKVSKAEINYHRAHYADANYVMPWAIANWPAHGRTAHGESANLAPYKNVSGNSSYTPSKGDYPLIRGDQAVLFITNDLGGKHTESQSVNPLGVEILGMAYAYNNPDSALQNTIFFSYDLQNKSAQTYYDFYFGYFIDFDLGYAYDDYMGCDTLLNLGYGYNGNEIDGSGEAWAYGENPPAQGVMFLNQKMSAFSYMNNAGGFQGDPNMDHQYYSRLQGKWNYGQPITYGGHGYNPESTDYTNFVFSGDPIIGTGWTELTPNGPGSTPNTPHDRRGMMSTGPFTFSAGETISIDITLPFARSYGGKSPLASLALLKQVAVKIQEYYDEYIVGIKENVISTGKLLVFPNPSNGQFTITSERVIESIEVYDMLGKKVYTNTPKVQTTIINTRLPQGFYIYRAVLEDHSICSGKMVVQ